MPSSVLRSGARHVSWTRCVKRLERLSAERWVAKTDRELGLSQSRYLHAAELAASASKRLATIEHTIPLGSILLEDIRERPIVSRTRRDLNLPPSCLLKALGCSKTGFYAFLFKKVEALPADAPRPRPLERPRHRFLREWKRNVVRRRRGRLFFARQIARTSCETFSRWRGLTISRRTLRLALCQWKNAAISERHKFLDYVRRATCRRLFSAWRARVRRNRELRNSSRPRRNALLPAPPPTTVHLEVYFRHWIRYLDVARSLKISTVRRRLVARRQFLCSQARFLARSLSAHFGAWATFATYAAQVRRSLVSHHFRSKMKRFLLAWHEQARRDCLERVRSNYDKWFGTVSDFYFIRIPCFRKCCTVGSRMTTAISSHNSTALVCQQFTLLKKDCDRGQLKCDRKRIDILSLPYILKSVARLVARKGQRHVSRCSWENLSLKCARAASQKPLSESVNFLLNFRVRVVVVFWPG